MHIAACQRSTSSAQHKKHYSPNAFTPSTTRRKATAAMSSAAAPSLVTQSTCPNSIDIPQAPLASPLLNTLYRIAPSARQTDLHLRQLVASVLQRLPCPPSSRKLTVYCSIWHSFFSHKSILSCGVISSAPPVESNCTSPSHIKLAPLHAFLISARVCPRQPPCV